MVHASPRGTETRRSHEWSRMARHAMCMHLMSRHSVAGADLDSWSGEVHLDSWSAQLVYATDARQQMAPRRRYIRAEQRPARQTGSKGFGDEAGIGPCGSVHSWCKLEETCKSRGHTGETKWTQDGSWTATGPGRRRVHSTRAAFPFEWEGCK